MEIKPGSPIEVLEEWNIDPMIIENQEPIL